ncbi:LacI family DNA-binding transcriptional regulator [Streptacidiphilus jiangxiensis]|uniref:DNA-binding transcriptional regulator, LacI/PurR family n=1 Tax=Streptacidiphilus jiangxiensis TaxID=235985 RepID=A0A1H7V821_STRJI|nr:LacI family DNA-binding transcriptional regulator [Streptacidiphilus jiangxiensis]SEM05180.1 DNA-binding transcriptional regulator, LacI/PurR family [Streptacidiphilus jiangxiensis]
MSKKPAPDVVTLVDVAKVAGVSRATVSRVVNGNASVAPSLRESVERAIAETGYTPNLAARSLVTRTTGSIALAVSDMSAGQIFADPFFGRVVSGVTQAVRPRGVQVVLAIVDDEPSRRQLINFLRQGHVDGVVLVSTHSDDPLPAALAEAKVPAVLFARPSEPLPISFVELDQRAGVFLAVDHLVALGRRRIAHASGPLDTPAGRERHAAFRERLAHHGLTEAAHAEGDFTQAGGADAMRALLAAAPDADAVFVASDLMALGAVGVLHRAGVAIPDRMALVGFDDSSAALTCDPPLTTVRQPVEAMAGQMAELLLEQIAAPERTLQSRVFQPALVVRESA